MLICISRFSFRLEGPFAFPEAVSISENELLRPVIDRGFVANAVFLLVIAAFGWVNALAYVLELVYSTALRLVHPGVGKTSKKMY